MLVTLFHVPWPCGWFVLPKISLLPGLAYKPPKGLQSLCLLITNSVFIHSSPHFIPLICHFLLLIRHIFMITNTYYYLFEMEPHICQACLQLSMQLKMIFKSWHPASTSQALGSQSCIAMLASCGVWDQTKGFMHTKQALCHWSCISSPKGISFSPF